MPPLKLTHSTTQLTQTIAEEDALTPATQWIIEGKAVSKVNGRDFVTGQHRYPADHTRPGLLHGKILRPPSFGATLTSVDTREAQKISGVTVVHDGGFVGVAAPSQDLADRAVASIHAEWKGRSSWDWAARCSKPCNLKTGAS